MSALMAEYRRPVDQRFLVKLFDSSLGHTMDILDLMVRHVTPTEHALLAVQAAKIKLENQRVKLLRASDVPYVQRLNACSQELRQDIVMVSGVFRVCFGQAPAPVAMRRLKHYLTGSLTRLSEKLVVAGKRARIDFSQSIAAASRLIALMQTIPERLTQQPWPFGENVVALNPNLHPCDAPKWRGAAAVLAPVIVASVHTAVPALDQYGPESSDLVLNAQAMPLEIVMFLRTKEYPQEAPKQRTKKEGHSGSEDLYRPSQAEEKPVRSEPTAGQPKDDYAQGDSDER